MGVAVAGCPEPRAGDAAEDPRPLLPLPEADDPKPDADDPEDPNADDPLLWGLPLLLLLLLPAASLGTVQAPFLAWKYSSAQYDLRSASRFGPCPCVLRPIVWRPL